jgi:virginiamycin B lyase
MLPAEEVEVTRRIGLVVVVVVASAVVVVGAAATRFSASAATVAAEAAPRVAFTSVPTAPARPRVITVGPDGAVWFANYFGSSLGRIGSRGGMRVIRHASMDWPAGIAVGPDGALWFANCASIGRVTTGGRVSAFLDPGIERPQGITAGPDGALWFTNDTTIARITTAGTVTVFRHPGIDRPVGITAGQDGALWFTNRDSIGRLTPAGRFSFFRHPSIDRPATITAAPDGALWFANAGGGSIGRITTAGAVSAFRHPGIVRPRGITVGSDGALWFTSTGNDAIGRLTTAGAFAFYRSSVVDGPVGITVGPDGTVWFANYRGASIGRARILPAETAASRSRGSERSVRHLQPTAVGRSAVPKSETIAYQEGGGGSSTVWTIRADGSERRQLPIRGAAPDWSPDGTRIAVGEDAIGIYTLLGKRLRSFWGLYGEPAWSPGGRTIAYVGKDQRRSGPDYDQPPDLWLVDLATNREKKVSEYVGDGANPSWSPDGKRLLVTSNAHGQYEDGVAEIDIVSLKTGRLVRVATGSVSAAAWSPKGGAIAFSTGHAIVVSRPDGTGRKTIATSKYLLDEPAWSPDAKHIVYTVLTGYWSPETSRGLRIIDVDGTHYRVLTDSGSHADWRPR